MYTPAAHQETRTEVVHELMQSYPLGCLVTRGKDGLQADHIPFLLDPAAGELGTLRGHVARTNPLWQESFSTGEAMVIFQGPQAYISPGWYPSKQRTGQAVPTWNYAVAHAHGIPRFIDEPAWLMKLVSDLSDLHEASQALPWKTTDAPKEFMQRMIDMIVGVEIPISRIEGKWKISQNRSEADRLGVAAGLEDVQAPQSQAMASLVRKTLRA